MAKWKQESGVVLGKETKLSPNLSVTAEFLTVELETGERITCVLDTKDENKVFPGDLIELKYQPKKKARFSGFLGVPKGNCKDIKVLKSVAKSY